MPDRPELLLASRCCSQCLTTAQRIVPGERAAQIVRDCRRDGQHFVCHKGSLADRIVHCRGVHEILLRDSGGSTAFRVAQVLGIAVVEVDADGLE